MNLQNHEFAPACLCRGHSNDRDDRRVPAVSLQQLSRAIVLAAGPDGIPNLPAPGQWATIVVNRAGHPWEPGKQVRSP
jgi:hypothetical protein